MAGISIIKKILPSSQTKYDWQASEGSPKLYPMEIIYGSLKFPDSGSLYVPNKVTLHHGWGNGRSSHVVGPDLKALPNRLSISFFSYTEDQFYDGEFELPYETILKLFQTGHYSPKDEGNITYHRIIVGVAPGGAVSVWVVSLDRTIEIFFGYAKKIEGNWKSIVDNPDITRKEFIQMEINDSLKPAEVESLKNNGIPFGLWEKYHKRRYSWQPEFINMSLLNGRIPYIKYFNGERDYIDIPVTGAVLGQTRAVPSEMIFIWLRPIAKPLRVKLYFNEDEIFNAFEKLGSKNIKLKFELQIKDNNQFSMTIRNDKDSVVLKQTKIKTYGIPKEQYPKKD